jgi:virulence factor Mce-like protein
VTRLVAGLLAVAACAAAIVLLSSGGGTYVVRLTLEDASGLRQRSPVMIGGVPAGNVSLHLDHGDRVIAQLNIDRSQAPVGRDASVAIAAVNFLGQKEVELTRGDLHHPAPSGYTIPSSQVQVSTDLDQVLDVLDAGTRARLAILVDEAGTALTGRREDFSRLLEQLPPSIQSADALLSRLVSDNHTLADLVTSSGRFISAVNQRRPELARVIGAAGQAARTLQARRTQLSQTLAVAPRTLVTLQSFLGRLRATTVPLGPAANELTPAARSLVGTLDQIGPFVSAARPALGAATQDAPELTRLASGATPVLVQAVPVVASLASFSTALRPISGILDHSVDNILAIVENWSRAIEFRDGLSHVFRGEASVTPDVLQSLIDRLTHSSSQAPARRHAARPQASGAPQSPGTHASGAPAPASGPASGPSPSPGSSPASGPVAALGNLLGQVVGGVTGQAPPPSSGSSTPPSSSSPQSSLLNYLLGR